MNGRRWVAEAARRLRAARPVVAPTPLDAAMPVVAPTPLDAAMPVVAPTLVGAMPVVAPRPVGGATMAGRQAMIAVLLSCGVAAPAFGQERYLYVADVAGEWVVVGGGDAAPLAPLSRLLATMRVRYAGSDPGDETAMLVLRDPRSLGKATVRCGARTRCAEPVEVARLRFDVAGVRATAQATALYDRLGDREGLRQRIRLVGARSEGRDAPLLVLALDRGGVPTADIVSAVSAPASTVVVRFCLLDEDDDSCLTTRRILASDCPLGVARCAMSAGPGAYRYDVYARERAMLATVPVASGFATIAPPGQVATARDQVQEALNLLTPSRRAFSADEWRGLMAGIALTVANALRR